MQSMMWWLSFADEHSFRGVTIAVGNNLPAAVGDAWKHDCNPGGEVMGHPVLPEHRELVADHLHVLYTDKSKVEEIFGPLMDLEGNEVSAAPTPEKEDDDDGTGGAE